MNLLKPFKRLERLLQRAVRRRFHDNCLIGDKPFFDKRLLSATADLEEGFPIIRAEVDEVMKRYDELTPFQTMSPDQESLSNDDRWKFFFLKCARIRFRKNIAMMPRTMEIVDRHKEIVSAYLSILAPGKSLPAHTGPWSGVLRAHLGVIVPDRKWRCRLEVAGIRYHWREGEVVFFDDTYVHTAHNPTDEVRVVLFMDVMRPMRHPYDWINRMILSVIWLFPYVWVPYFRHKKWERKFHGKNK